MSKGVPNVVFLHLTDCANRLAETDESTPPDIAITTKGFNYRVFIEVPYITFVSITRKVSCRKKAS